MIDIHTHLLPGFDDGAEDEIIALRTVHRAVTEEGITHIFITPHSDAFDRCPERFPSLFARLQEYFPNVSFYPGCEVLCEINKMEQILRALDSGQYLSMNGSPYVLAEFSDEVEASALNGCLLQLIEHGWKPILAHAERYQALLGHWDRIDRLIHAGVLLQINTYNLSRWDAASHPVMVWAQALVAGRRASFLGTDTHGLIRRPPAAKRGLDWLQTACGEDPAYIAAITESNARTLLINNTTQSLH